MRIDAHQHFWKFNPVRDAWITEEMQVIRRDFRPEDLKPLLEQHAIDGCVAVQADQSQEENNVLLSLAKAHPLIKGVVGWVDLLADDLQDQLDSLVQEHVLKGVRHILQAEPEGFMLQAKFIAGLKMTGEMGLTYDVLTKEGQLPETLELVKALPEMKLVVDHISKPDIASSSFDHWKKYMSQLAKHEHIHVKLSGMVTEANWQTWGPEDLKPYVDFCLEKFGAKRLMYGSDWPVCLLAGDYSSTIGALETCLKALSDDEQQYIFGNTATDFYHLN